MASTERKGREVWPTLLRITFALLGLFVCYRLTVGSARYGTARLFSTLAMITPSVEPADAAVRVNPADPEAHYARALSLLNSQRLIEAVAELQQAIRLRPHHYYQWLDLGVTIQRLEDQSGAEAALRESVRLAPSFAQPRWQLGNLLYRDGRYQEAFEHLRLATKSHPGLVEGMLNLAWVAAEEDVGRFEALVRPETGRSHIELGQFLAKRGKGIDAARHIRESGGPRDAEERSLLHVTISELLALGKFSDAFDVWVTSHPSAAVGKAQILNGDFLDPILADDPGFGWQVPVVPNVVVSIDPSGPNPNTRSLSVEYSGESSTAGEVIHQLVLLAPNSRYSLTFQSKTERLISGGAPVIVVSEAGNAPKPLGQSEALSPGLGDWTTYTVNFSAGETTSAVVISLGRLACSQSPCPVFGKLWLSGFKLMRTTPERDLPKRSG